MFNDQIYLLPCLYIFKFLLCILAIFVLLSPVDCMQFKTKNINFKFYGIVVQDVVLVKNYENSGFKMFRVCLE